jgi:hypothetical protein
VAIYRIVSGEILAPLEYRERAREAQSARASAGKRALRSDRQSKPDTKVLALSRYQQAIAHEARLLGSSRKQHALRAAEPASTTAFMPIGPNKPLTVLIAHVYTGKYPKTGWFEGSKEDMLLTTACKDDTVFNAMPRALNYLVSKVGPNTDIKAPPATTAGTRLVFYSPAITIDSLIVTLEIKFHDFGPDLIRKIASAAGAAAGIPIFVPAAPYLLAASTILNIGANVGQSLFDADTALSQTETLDFNEAGSTPVSADFRLVTNSAFDSSGLEYQAGKGLASRSTGKLYDGDQPYIVISLDGAEKPNLANFAPTHASAAVLQTFYGVSDASSALIDGFVDAMKVVNDLKFRDDADKLTARIKATSDTQLKQKLQTQLDADLKNISDDRLKPPAS